MIPRGLPDHGLAGFDLCDQLTFEFGFELSTNFSHYELLAPLLRAKKAAREGLWKMSQLWKSTKVAFGDFLLMISASCLEKPSQKPLGLSHPYHSADGHYPYLEEPTNKSPNTKFKLLPPHFSAELLFGFLTIPSHSQTAATLQSRLFVQSLGGREKTVSMMLPLLFGLFV